MERKAVHFGAGNIGRGFVGLVLHNAGYEIVFADVAAELIDALNASPTYRVREVGVGGSTSVVDIVTTAVGPNILRFVAPLIARAIEARDPGRAPLAVMACENAINATDILAQSVREALADPPLADRAVFANTAVDRIVPGQTHVGLDVTVEKFFEWAIEKRPFNGNPPVIPEAHFVDDLAPYIERKLFTVNTGHATIAYHGFIAGETSISEALAIPDVGIAVRAVLAETKALLVAKHEFDPAVQQAYIDTILTRFGNPELADTVQRVGRQPLRKLGRNERFISPAAELAERGFPTTALVHTIAAALRFEVADDPQSVELAGLLDSLSADDFVRQVTGLEDTHPLFPAVRAVVAGEQARR
jgi:mannitol-1-phosphate 5-dehydrogenase